MTIRNLCDGQLVLVRATVVAAHPYDASVSIVGDDHGARHPPIFVPYGELMVPPSVDAAYEAMRVLLQKLHDLEDTTDKLRGMAVPLYNVGARVMAEIAELGVLTGTGKIGLCGCASVATRPLTPQ